MKISVLICTYNRHELLRKSLRSIIEGSEEKPDQVVVVNGGDEQADRVVESFMGRDDIEVKLVKTKNINLATSRNIGLSHCSCDIVAMTDDDAEVFPDWISRMKNVHQEHPEAGGVGGAVLGMDAENIIAKVSDIVTFPRWKEPCYVRTLPGVNISYKREVISEVGLQDVSLFRGEDVDFNWRVKQLGKEIYFDPAIKVWHYHRPTFSGLINQHYMYGRAYFLVRRKWKDMYSIYPHDLRSIRNFLKLINFFVSAIYQPFLDLKKLDHWLDRLLALPVLFLVGVAWRLGMGVQFFKELDLTKSQEVQTN